MNSPSQFEVDVRNLLRLQGWTVSAEQILGHKKVDAYAEKLDEFGSKMRIAIECKHWSASLTQHEVTEIYVNYYPLVEKSLIDLLLIVTLNGISPSAETYVSNTETLAASHLRKTPEHNYQFRLTSASGLWHISE